MAAPRSAVVVAYDDRWPVDFETVREYLAPALAKVAVTVEHVGSTAVPGLAGKPVIDVDVVADAAGDVPAIVAALASLGFEHRGDLGVPGREAFSVLSGLPEHHLYAVVRDSPAHRDHVHLRDHLRTHPVDADRYAAEKRRLAPLLRTNREAYVEGKAWLVRELLDTARAERSAVLAPAEPHRGTPARMPQYGGRSSFPPPVTSGGRSGS